MADRYNEWDYLERDGNYPGAYDRQNSQPYAGPSSSAGRDQSQSAYGPGDGGYADQTAENYNDNSYSGTQYYAQYAAAPPPHPERYPEPRTQLLYSPTDGRTVHDFYTRIDNDYRLMGDGNSPASPVDERPGLDVDRKHSSYYSGLDAGFHAALEGKPVSIVSTDDGKLGVVVAPEPGSSLDVGVASPSGSYYPSVGGANSNASVYGLAPSDHSMRGADSDASVFELAPSDHYELTASPDRRSQDQTSVVRIDAAGKRHWATWEQAAIFCAAVGTTGEALARAFVAPAGVVGAVAVANASEVVNGLWKVKGEFAKLQRGEKPNWDEALNGISKTIAYGAIAGIPAQVYRSYQPDAGDPGQVVFDRNAMRMAALPAGVSAAGFVAALVFDKRARAQMEKEARTNQHHGAAGLQSRGTEGRERGQEEDAPSHHRRKGKGKDKVRAAAPGS
ncbi:hypothetical protein ACIA3K_17470 [Micromonospora sp. NPDC051543]|uniref:hypothetical protein n=1 Tax=Micromonospora sp. NPDC051543 TaxID=3364287 RepID=UPI00378C447C